MTWLQKRLKRKRIKRRGRIAAWFLWALGMVFIGMTVFTVIVAGLDWRNALVGGMGIIFCLIGLMLRIVFPPSIIDQNFEK